MKSKFLTFLSVVLILSSCSTNKQIYYPIGEPSKAPMPSKPGSCYAKVFIPSQYSYDEKIIHTYTGDNVHQEGLELRETIISQATSQWQKKKADINCISANPDDCMVWCLVQIPAVIDTTLAVTDTTLIKDFKIDTIKTKKLISYSKTDWAEVLCEHELTSEITTNIITKLFDLGYLEEPMHQLRTKARKGLKRYQEDHNIAQGALTLETLDLLGVEY